MPRHHQYLDVYCCLSHEFLLAYPQPRSSIDQRKSRNTNALERTKDHYANVVYPSKRRWMTKESFDDQIELDLNNEEVNRSKKSNRLIQMADGDKRMKNIINNLLDQFGQQRNHHRSKKHGQSSSIWRQYPFMSSPLVKPSKRDKVKTTKISSSLSHSSTTGTESNSSMTSPESAHSLETSSEMITKNNSLTNVSVVNSVPSIQGDENIEEFQPLIEIVSPSAVPSALLNNIISSFFPTLSSPDSGTMIFHSEQQPIQVRSLSESIEELCLLIRQLLHLELTEQNITPLQATIASRLALLLTYLVAPDHQMVISNARRKDTMERMTSTEDGLVEKTLLLTIGTQTDLEKDVVSTRKTHSFANPIDIHQTLSLEEKQQEITELVSTSGKNNNEISK